MDRKFVIPNVIIRIEPIMSKIGPYCVSDLPTFNQSEITGTKKLEYAFNRNTVMKIMNIESITSINIFV